MKYIILLLSVFITNNLLSQVEFDKYFKDKTLRFDYTIGGNHDNSEIFYNKVKEEVYWGGSKKNLIDKFNFGDFRIQVFDSASNTLTYSRGYSSLYYEWIDLDEAKHISKSYYESVVFPYPKSTILLKIAMREENTKFKTLFETYINPDDYLIIKDKQNLFTTEKLHNSGDHHEKLDIVILPDGYTKDEMGKFKKDSERFIGYFFDVEPFKSHKDKVNFWIVNAESEESGTDIPGEDIWKNTILNSHFYTFRSERYLTTSDVETIRNLAAYVPYDQIYILVNSPKYGGGGIYNYYNLCSADHIASGRVFTHEFGHAFAALADEYEYGFGVAEDIYDMNVEPWQVNITNLTNFDSKWKHLVKNTTPVPTPGDKKYFNEVGAFEGAGYVKKKIYRPTNDCKMRSNNTDEFCPVCYKTVLDMLLFYSE